MTVIYSLLLHFGILIGVYNTPVVYSLPLGKFYPFGTENGDNNITTSCSGCCGGSLDVELSVNISFSGVMHDQIEVWSEGIMFFTYHHSYVVPFYHVSACIDNNDSTVWYRETDDPSLLVRAEGLVRRSFSTQADFTPTSLFIVTWYKIGRYNNINETNTFQCVLVTDGTNSFTIFNYADGLIQWVEHFPRDKSFPLIGYNDVPNDFAFFHPDSRTDKTIDIARSSNTGVPGMWIFRLDEEDIVTSQCINGNEVIIPPQLVPRFANMLGGSAVFINGPCFDSDDDIKCYFDGQETSGVYVDETLSFCVVPTMDRLGLTSFTLEITKADESSIHHSQMTILSPDRAHAADITSPKGLLLSPEDTITVTWSPDDITPDLLNIATTEVMVDIVLYLQQYPTPNSESPTWRPLKTLAENIPNNGTAEVKIPSGVSFRCNYPRISSLRHSICPVAIKVSMSSGSSIGIWTGIAYLPSTNISEISKREACTAWSESEKVSGAVTYFSTFLPCPPNQAVAHFDSRYEREVKTSITGDTKYEKEYMDFFHSNIQTCFIQATPNADSSGQQCCYGSDGNLVKGATAGGSADAMSPKVNFNRHLVDDLLPYVLCCKTGPGLANCGAYYDVRPSGSETDYILPIPACIYGDPHIVTLDGHKYTFNGKGEFTLIETTTKRFTLQGRMEQAIDVDGAQAQGTVFTAIVAREENTDTSVQFEVRSETLRVSVDSQRVEFEDTAVEEFGNVSLIDKGNDTVIAYFSEGANIEIKAANGIISVMLVSLPESMKWTTRGLMGNFNGITQDDLIPKSQTDSIPLESSLQDIHYNFGLTWIINNSADSLFSYPVGSSWSDFYDPDFSPMFEAEFEDAELEEEAKAVCGDDTFCLFDIAATKNTDIGMATMEDGANFDVIVEMAVPITCDPPCANGVCIEENICKCNEGFEGETCDLPVMEECEVSLCANNGTCTKQALSYLCNCPPGFIGGLCEIKEPPFSIEPINSSPRVSPGRVEFYFFTSTPAQSTCSIRGEDTSRETDCSSGYMSFSDLSPGSYILRIVSKATATEEDVISRTIHISNTTESCDVHLINRGVVITGSDVVIQFYGSMSVSQYRCGMRKNDESIDAFIPCRSPVRYAALDVGIYHYVVKPVGCSGKGKPLSVDFEII